ARDRADISARIDRARLEPAPLRITIGQLDTLDPRQIDDVDPVLGAPDPGRRHVVAHRLAEREEREIEAAVLAVHRRALPRTAGRELREDLHVARLEAVRASRDREIAAATHRQVAGHDLDEL